MSTPLKIEASRIFLEGVRLWKLRKKKKEKSKAHPLKVSAAAYGNGRLRECVNTEFV